MNLKYYVYRFLDKDNNIIYIGKTNNLNRRMTGQHFSHRGHLTRECYVETEKIEYSQYKSSNMMSVYEIFLINRHTPRYNQEFNYAESMDIVLPEPIWTDYPITDAMRHAIKAEEDEAYWIAKDLYDIESWHMCFAALGGGL